MRVPLMEHVKQSSTAPLSATLFTEYFWGCLIQMHPFEYTLSRWGTRTSENYFTGDRLQGANYRPAQINACAMAD